ncbi:TonB-dependent siderophore receptor [Methylocystis parvus]|uniref:TonB-dependent siderophore receptor n=1 Tax=Methylocystis parvus TaxID=134 RepID=A0A6B8M4P2_9HYPH|nr:TonB-dependent siderophore receptor [Methylocystis parvus]QGM96739.1 TonB-dependent siderophore receptor [Methylocystis parvus]WBJ99391.1 TonB-dependent siderophore receptor [Methylocystis parvus OBBP]
MNSHIPSAKRGELRLALRSCASILPCVLSAALSTPTFGQQTLPTIDVTTPKPRIGRAAGRPAAPSASQTAPTDGGVGVVGNNGTEIGPGNNGQICANGICNDPTSYAAPIGSLGAKVNTPVMDTPVTTKMVTRQMLEDQQAITLDQALKNVSGVAFAGGGDAALGNAFTQIMLRGFPTQNYFRDGFRVDSFGLNFAGSSAVEMANVESIEVLKGPAAILYGAVEPGGIVNLNTKQPLDKPAFSIQQQVGSYAAFRTTLDSTGPVTPDKDVLYRFVMSYENDGSFRALGYNRNIMINPVVRWNIDSNTWVRASAQFQQNNFNQDMYWTPYFGMYTPLWLGRSFNWGPKSPYNQQQNFTEFTWHHDFNKDWSIQQTAFMQLLRNDWANNGGFGFISDCLTPGSTSCFSFPSSNNVTLNWGAFPSDNRQAEYATTVNLVGHFNTSEQLNHTLLSGVDYYRYNFRGQNQLPLNYSSSVIFGAPQPSTPVSGLVPYSATEQYADNLGVYLQDQIKLPYGVTVLGGARYQYINSRTGATDNAAFCGPYSDNAFAGLLIPCNFDTITKRGQSISQRVTPRVGLLWRPLDWVSFYGNYAESYSPNYNGKLVSGTNDPTPPSAGAQMEGGVKFSWFDGRIQATAAYYHLVKTNIPIGIPNDFTHVMLIGEGRSQGPELDSQGEIIPGWNVNLAYANTDAITTKSNPFYLGVPAVGAPIPFVPRNVGSLSSSYEFRNGELKGLRLGARYDYTGYLPFYHYANDGTYIYGQSTPGYGLVGIFGAYEFNVDKFKVTAQLNVSNLFDKTYFTTGGLGPQAFDASHPGGYAVPYTNPMQVGWNLPGYNYNVVGAPRILRGSIKVSF